MRNTRLTSSEIIDKTFPTDALALSPPAAAPFSSSLPGASLRRSAFSNSATVSSLRSRMPIRRA